jgi:hypothetical protein
LRRLIFVSNIKQEINKIVIPSTLHHRAKMGVKKANSEKGGKLKRYVRNNIAVVILAASLIVPTGAIAYQSFLVEEFYGSFEDVKIHISSATMEGYLLLDAKLTQAQGDMEKGEYKRFKELLSVITTAKVDYGDKYGNIDYSQVPNEQLLQIENTLLEIQPFFDQLNGQKSSREVLSTDEYKEYIHAIMVYEQIMAQSGMKESDEVDKIPSDLKEDYLNARNILRQVNEKQLMN